MNLSVGSSVGLQDSTQTFTSIELFKHDLTCCYNATFGINLVLYVFERPRMGKDAHLYHFVN